MPEKWFLVMMCTIVGALAGVGAFLLKGGISLISRFVTGHSDASLPNFALLILPLIGIVLCALFCRYVIKDNLEFGCEKISDDLKEKKYKLKRHLTFSPIVACSLTLGFGGSAGSEGPIAYTGAGLGSNLGQFFGLSNRFLRILIGVGAGAGIAAIFKSPIGGAMFTLEVLKMELTTISVIALFAGCITASTVAYILSGFTLDIAFSPTVPFTPHMIPAIIMLGIFCGLYSIFYSSAMTKTVGTVRKIKNPWIKNLTTGALISGLIFIFPALYGEGYGAIGHIINGESVKIMDSSLFHSLRGEWVLIIFLLGTIAVKSIATGATNSGGGVGGDFAPTLFAGCLAGLLFAKFFNLTMGTAIPEADFALFGMAGVMAGSIQAPLMALFLVAEMCGDFGMFLPLLICAIISFGVVKIFSRHARVKIHPSWRHNNTNHTRE